ncbi:MAG TPA: trypco2 family protein [Terracidiphilus sp.]|jgi:hypothetical protein
METTKSIGLAELLAQVRAEIDQSQENLRKSGKPAAIDWESAEIEISFGVTKGGNAKGSANIHIFAIEVGGNYNSQEVHRLTLHLKPHEKSSADKKNSTKGTNRSVGSIPVAIAARSLLARKS